MNERLDPIAPRLSVVVPLYNDQSYIGENLKSVLANADGIDLEIIVVNDGSTDGSLTAARNALAETSVAHQIFTTPNGGLSAARNFGLSKAKGQYVAFLDSDDFFGPHAYKAMVDLADADRCAQVFARAQIYDAKTGDIRNFYDFDVWDEIIGAHKQRSFEPFDLPLVFLTQPKICTRIWRRDYLTGHGLYFPEGRVFEDIGVHLQSLALNGRVGIVEEAGLYYRHGHEGRITAEKSRARFDVIENARAALQAPEVARLDPIVGGHLLASLMRMVLWCRMGLPQEMKRDFDRQVASLSGLMDHKVLAPAYSFEPKVIRRFLLAVIKFGGWGAKGRAIKSLAAAAIWNTRP